ncbi:hypothetical protein RI129_007157 [Pyrocoelia pectoralis]|uniref:Glucose-methanol-choline oxidoreductase N-terminal domain-containing protein n=1 Tax=Pyrocoelia pectoralis TaxID=417401 RepID=A0AAN7ZIB0_9COLE
MQLNTLNGVRDSVANAYLKPIVKERSNLRILTRSLVIKILINCEKKAYGVLFSRNGKMYVAKSRRDIVISAGTINSPQLLMLSGIGPKRHLEEMGIQVLQNLPVGENVEDHPVFPYFEFSTNFTEMDYSLRTLAEGYLRNDGSLSNPANTQGVSFIQTSPTKIPGYPDVELLMLPSISRNLVSDRFWNINEETLEATSHVDNLRTFSIFVTVLHPKSKGYIRLQSANPFEYPLINLNMLSDDKDEDIETMYQGVQVVLNLTATLPFRRLHTKAKDFTLPACRELEYLSKEYWYCQLRYLTASLYHPVASCKMGVHPSLGAVVNPELKVFGIKNLRVADASVIPSAIAAHTNAASIMIGEKAAELIRGRV